MTNYPIKQVLRKSELEVRMVAWSVELSGFNIQYEPRDHMKTRFMADFLVEFAGNDITTLDWWTLYVDGAPNIKESGGRDHPRKPWQCHFRAILYAQLQSLKQPGRVQGAHCRFEASKRIRSQEATMLHGLVVSPRTSCQHIPPDQWNSAVKYYHIVKSLIENFKYFEIYYIPMENNSRADLLSKLASTKKARHLKTII